MTKTDIYERGIEQGRSLVTLNFLQSEIYGMLTECTDEEEWEELWEDYEEELIPILMECDENSRQYSPFEFFAKELNEAKECEELWEAYDDGIFAGIEMAMEELKMEIIPSWEDVVANNG